MFLDRLRRLADRPYPGRVELAALAVLYGAYELVRGFGTENWVAARAHTGDIVGPAAPPRLANLGFADTVSTHTGLNLSSDLLGSLYNPIAAVPSLHFGYSLIVGVAVAQLASRRSLRLAGAAYPALMLLIIVATGNHFLFDAAAGGLVVVAGRLVAARLRAPATTPVRLVTPHEAWAARPAPQHAQAA